MIRLANRVSTGIRLSVNTSSNSLPRSRCVLCLAPAHSGRFCSRCENALPVLNAACGTCALPLPSAAPRCGRCQAKPPAFDRIRAQFPYVFPVDAMIGQFKFHGDLAMARPMVALMARSLAGQNGPKPNVLVPCPLHPKRFRERGFNQAAVVADALGKALDIPVDYRLCTRSKATPTQTRLDRAARLRNLNGVFAVRKKPPKRVAVIDDVVTTGATAQHLAAALKEAGAQEVEVWALARTPLN